VTTEIEAIVLGALQGGERTTAQLRSAFPKYHRPNKRALFWKILDGMRNRGLIVQRKAEPGPDYAGDFWSLPHA
jgi:hypothetical protein